MKAKFLATVKNQKLIFPTGMSALYYSHLKSLEGKDIEISIGKRKRDRTLKQNALHWARMTIIGKTLGYDKEEMHYVFKKQFLSDKLYPLQRDQFIEYLQSIDKNLFSTRNLSTIEMAEFTEKIERQAAELEIELPSPED